MKQVDRDSFARFLRELGIGEGDVVLCHSFLPSLGRPAHSADEDVLGGILDVLGPQGNLFAPTFTYSYMNGEEFDADAAPSKVGVLGDLVRSRPDATRSLDGNFSNAGIGPRAAAFLERTNKCSFGPGTFYDRLVEVDAKILLIGVDFTALPLFMHIERLENVPYRFEKTFRGVTRQNGRTFEDEVVHFVRDFSLSFDNDRTRVGAAIEQDPTSRSASFGYGVHRITCARTVIDQGVKLLRADPHSLIKFVKSAHSTVGRVNA